MRVPIGIWGASRMVCLGLAHLTSRMVMPHDFSASILGESGLVSSLLRWDALFFYLIAREGYTSDKSTAFFPLYPLLVRLLSHASNQTISIAWSGFLLSNGFFCCSAVILYRLTERFFDKRTAICASVLFCFSPCSILYSAMYTESAFCFFVLGSIYALMSQQRLACALLLGCASATRSNGVTLAPLIAFEGLRNSSYRGVGYALVPVAVFLGIQLFWWYTRFRHIGFMLPYSYIQTVFWEQGFLRFYTYPKNIPNVFVGLPFVLLSTFIAGRVTAREWRALQAVRAKKTWKAYLTTFKVLLLFLNATLIFQILLSIFFIHMNMHFRFVSFNPLIYWELASFFSEPQILSSLMLFGYLSFGVAYSVLFGAYFPPA
ncbi:phosphatidylinositol glycan, class V [Nematocida displodere]|uniref:GPI mannosyltransferase 2 n=1 Tax=Nematocida displodere TaxID=1805483 RepID=A0A177ECW0_9MICR|nr:phosphatidylinositol glycan, class V [Nematocida displodere]